MCYEKEFKIFESNINQAARSLYYHLEINRQIYDDGLKHENMHGKLFQDSKIYQAIQYNAQFWSDHGRSSIVDSIIALGRIFDKRKDSHGLRRLIKTAKKSNLFKHDALRERKIKGSDNAEDWIDEYMKNAYELTNSDFNHLSNFCEDTYIIWETVHDLRHKIFAHQGIMSDEEEKRILEKSDRKVFEEIIGRLLTIEKILWEAFHNGTKPDFSYENQNIKNAVKSDVANLLEKLSQ